jgi:hypothetical protein
LEHGTFSVAREWTDWADPYANHSLGSTPPRLDADLLLDLVNLLEHLSSQDQEGYPKEIDK